MTASPTGTAGVDVGSLEPYWQQAVAAVERIVGGTVTRFEPQPRWRPAAFLDLERPDGEVVPLYWRGARGALDHGISDLAYERDVLDVLEAHGIPVPHVHGYNDDPQGLVLERRRGKVEPLDADTEAERVAVLDHYVDILARIHQIPVAAFEAKGLRRPVTADEVGLGDFAKWEQVFRDKKVGPAPMEEFGIRWVHRHVPRDRADVCYVLADCGQFLYEDGRVTTVFDLEFSYLGDPAAELAGLRVRDAAHKLGDVRRAVHRYFEITGTAIPTDVIDYHTARFAWVNPLSLKPICDDPPADINYVQYRAWYVLCSRWGLDVMARMEGVDEPPPTLAPAAPTGRAGAYASLVDGLAPAREPDDPARAYHLGSQQRTAQYLQQVERHGAAVDAADRDELAAILGWRPATWEEGEAALERFVLEAGAEHDATLVRFFRRRLQREEVLLAPALGYLQGSALPPID